MAAGFAEIALALSKLPIFLCSFPDRRTQEPINAPAAAGAESALLAGKYHQPLEVAFVAAHPEKAVFEAAALQVCLEHPVNMAEHVRPTRIVIEDALKEGDHSVLEYNTMTIKDLPERVFTQQYLRRL